VCVSPGNTVTSDEAPRIDHVVYAGQSSTGTDRFAFQCAVNGYAGTTSSYSATDRRRCRRNDESRPSVLVLPVASPHSVDRHLGAMVGSRESKATPVRSGGIR